MAEPEHKTMPPFLRGTWNEENKARGKNSSFIQLLKKMPKKARGVVL